MWKARLQKHCSDQDLIAFADGEASLFTRRSVRTHLEDCWQCRARLSELEGQAQKLARVLQEDLFLPVERRIAARRKLEANQALFEAAAAPSRERNRLFVAAALVAGIAAMVALLVQPRREQAKQDRGLEPAQILRMVKAGEATRATDSVAIYQLVEVEILGGQPARTASGRLKIWSDPEGHRTAVRWEGADGRLKYGMWQPGLRNRPIYRIAEELRPRLAALKGMTAVSIADLPAGPFDPERMAAAFLTWLASREWRPIALSSDFALFGSREGVTLEVGEVAGPGKMYRLRAMQSTGDRGVEALLEVDANNYKPGLSVVRFISPKGSVEFRMRVVRTEALVPGTLSADLFRPDPPLEPVKVQPLPVALPVAPASSGFSDPELDSAEVSVTYALHRAGACLGEPISLRREARGGIRVEGVVRTAARKAELVRALASIGATVPVTLDIQTFDEAAGGAVAGTAVDEPIAPVRASKLPLEDDLIRHFSGAASTSTRVARFANDSITASQRAMAHAWAARRLLESFPAARTAVLGAQPRYLMQIMTRDHFAALWTSLAEMRAILEPVLTSISPNAFDIARAAQAESDGDAFQMLFEAIGRIDEGLRYLLAGEPAKPGSGLGGTNERIAGIGRDFAVIHHAFGRLETTRVDDAGLPAQ